MIISLNSNLILHIYVFLRKVSGGKEIRLYVQSSKNPDQKNELDNDLRDLGFYSLEDGDFILVRWVLDTQLWELNKPKSKAAVELKENHCFIEAGRNCFIASNQHSFVKSIRKITFISTHISGVKNVLNQQHFIGPKKWP